MAYEENGSIPATESEAGRTWYGFTKAPDYYPDYGGVRWE